MAKQFRVIVKNNTKRVFNVTSILTDDTDITNRVVEAQKRPPKDWIVCESYHQTLDLQEIIRRVEKELGLKYTTDPIA